MAPLAILILPNEAATETKKNKTTDWSSFDLTLAILVCAEPSKQLAILTVLLKQQTLINHLHRNSLHYNEQHKN